MRTLVTGLYFNSEQQGALRIYSEQSVSFVRPLQISISPTKLIRIWTAGEHRREI